MFSSISARMAQQQAIKLIAASRLSAPLRLVHENELLFGTGRKPLPSVSASADDSAKR